MGQCITPESVNESFIANAPLISATIKNYTLQAPSWFRDMLNPTPWPEGEGTIMQDISFQGELPQVEEGFDKWATVDDPSGCGNICAPNCSYNMHVLGGHAWNTKLVRLMSREFRSPDYCVKSIQTTRQYEKVFTEIVRNLYNQINFQKEFNIGQNYMSTISKKILVDGSGFKVNPADPYVFPPKGNTAVLGALSIGGLTRLYETLRRQPKAIPFMYSQGAPMYAMVASPELIADLFRSDPTLKADLRAAAAGNSAYGEDLMQRYSFNYTVRDMFLPVPYLTPRRFRWDTTLTAWVRILPFVRGIKGNVGTFSDTNPAYEDPSIATHESVLFHGMNPFSIYYRPTVQTIGEGTSFGPENGFWDVFQWVNPQTREDPARREGFFFTTAEIALSPDNSEGVIEWLVPRPPASSVISYYPAGPVCPPTADSCSNLITASTCPTATILSLTPHPITAGRYYVVFSAPVSAIADDVILLEESSGGFVGATVVTVASGSKTFEVSISGTVPSCDRFIKVFDTSSLQCKSRVRKYSVNASDATRLDLILELPLRAYTAAQTITLTYGDDTQVSATIVSADMLTNKWIVDIGSSAFVDNVGGVKEICVPTATVAACPGCSLTLTTETQCS